MATNYEDFDDYIARSFDEQGNLKYSAVESFKSWQFDVDKVSVLTPNNFHFSNILWMNLKPRTSQVSSDDTNENSMDVLNVKQEGSSLIISYYSEEKPLAAAILTTTSFESYSDQREFKFKAEDCTHDQTADNFNLLIQFCKEYLSGKKTSTTFEALCRKYVSKRDVFGFSLLHHFIFNGFTKEIMYLESIMRSSIFPLFIEIEKEKVANTLPEEIYSKSKNHYMKEKCKSMLHKHCIMFKGKAGFDEFVANELARLSNIRLLGVATDNTEFKTRLLYLYNFLTVTEKLLLANNTTIGLKSSQEIRERVFKDDKYVKTMNVEKVARYEMIIGWFLLFNYGHLGDERVLERNILYNMWKSCFDVKKTPRRDKTSKSSQTPGEEPKKETLKLDNDLGQSNEKTPKKPKTQSSDSPNHKVTPPRSLFISTPTSSSSANNYFQPSTPLMKDYINLKQNDISLSEKCTKFLKNFPEKCKERAEDYIRSSDWNHFHRVLAIWRLVNKMGGEANFEFDFKSIEGTLLFIGEYFFECLSKSTNSLLKSFFIVRQLAYLLSDNPENSLFILNSEKLTDIFKDENIISKLYTRSDLRGRTLQFENEYYLNTSLMNEKYASKMLFHLKNNRLKNECELSEDLFQKKTSEEELKEEKHFATVVYPVFYGGDFALYRDLKSKFGNRYGYLVQKWVGGQYPEFSLVFYFLQESSLQHLTKILGNSCEMWKTYHNSCFSKILGLSRSYNIITDNLKKIGNLILKEFFTEKYSFEIDCSNNSEIMWTLAYGPAEAVDNLTQYSRLFEQKDEIFESLSLYNSYMNDVISTGCSTENDSHVFMFLWGNLLIKHNKIGYTKQFDVCWVKMDKLKVSLYLGEAKNNCAENAETVFDDKLSVLGLPDPTRFQMQEKNLTVGVWEKPFNDLKIYKINNLRLTKKDNGASVTNFSVFFVSTDKKDTKDNISTIFNLQIEEIPLDVNSPMIRKNDISLCEISTLNSERFKNGNGKFIIAHTGLKLTTEIPEEEYPGQVKLKDEEDETVFALDVFKKDRKKKLLVENWDKIN